MVSRLLDNILAYNRIRVRYEGEGQTCRILADLQTGLQAGFKFRRQVFGIEAPENLPAKFLTLYQSLDCKDIDTNYIKIIFGPQVLSTCKNSIILSHCN